MKPRIRHQQGVILVISLIILLLLTLVGVTAMRMSVSEEKMAGNMRDRSLAFQAAEAGARDAESFIEGVAFINAFDGNNGLLGKDDAEPTSYFTGTTWRQDSSRAYAGDASTFRGVASQPRYIIKYLGKVAGNGSSSCNFLGCDDFGETDRNVFKITARGVGQSDTSQVILQTYYACIQCASGS